MLKYGPTFVRSLLLVWLFTWILADPLFLLQDFMAPQEFSTAHSFIRNGPVDKHVAQHYLDVRISSSTEGTSNRSQEIEADESGFGSRVDLRRIDRSQLVTLTVSFQHWFPFPTSAVPRAPPSISS